MNGALCIAALVLASLSAPRRIAPFKSAPVVREIREVVVDSAREQWQLVWREPPQPICSPGNPDEWSTGPCIGFAFAEYGRLDLIRAAPGRHEQRLSLNPLFEEIPPAPSGSAVVQRWPELESDWALGSADPDSLARLVHARPPAEVMRFGDYDHDGHATEFPLQIGASPVGHRQTVLVGVSRHLPLLHAFGTVMHPNEPLVLESPSQWAALRDSGGNATVVQWSCGDHGGDEQEEYELHADSQGIHATRLVYACSESTFARGKLQSRVAF